MPHQQHLAALVAQNVVGDAACLARGPVAVDRRQMVPDGVRRGSVGGMGEVGLEEDVVLAHRRHHLRQVGALEPGGGVELAPEVLRRSQLELGQAVGGVLVQLEVEGFEEEGDHRRPLSTETILSDGKRSSRPEVMTLTMTRRCR